MAIRYDLLKTDLLKLLFLTLPAFAGFVLVQSRSQSGILAGFIFLMYLLMLTIIAISGIFVSWLVRDKPNANKLSLLG